MRNLYLLALLPLLTAQAPPAPDDPPDSTHFYCKSEESASAIGAAFVDSPEEADRLGHAKMVSGECIYEKEPVQIVVVRDVGLAIGTHIRMRIVEFSLIRKVNEGLVRSPTNVFGIIPTFDRGA